MPRYNKEIQRIKNHCQVMSDGEVKSYLEDIWNNSNINDEDSSCLFVQCAKTFTPACGCPIEIQYKTGPEWAQTDTLTEWILNEPILPFSDEITLSDLEAFADIQRHVDQELNRVWPEEVGV